MGVVRTNRILGIEDMINIEVIADIEIVTNIQGIITSIQYIVDMGLNKRLLQ